MTDAAHSGWRAGNPAGPLSGLGLFVVAATVIVDQATKILADTSLAYGEPLPLLPILTLFRVNNPGIAFSMFADSSAWLMTLVPIVVSAVVVGFWVRTHEGGRLAAAGFALILGGAIGNLIDRLRLGHVIDFLLLHIGDRSLFVFNIADVALTIGPALLLIVYLWPGGNRPAA